MREVYAAPCTRQTKRGLGLSSTKPRFRGLKSGRAGLGAQALAPRQLTRQMGELYPETEHPQANLRVPANFARSWRLSRYAAAIESIALAL